MINYVSVDRIFSKLHRDLKGTDLDEIDIIEWTGEALDFLKVPQILEEDVKFVKVENYEADVPKHLFMISQIARSNIQNVIIENPKEEIERFVTGYDSCGKPNEYIQEKVDLDWSYINWTNSRYYKNNFTPVRLSTNTFFNSIVCKEKDMEIYKSCTDEYTIIGTIDKKLRFSFKEGWVAISYLKNTVDKETGYPLIPEDISYLTAITYYIKWKIAERYTWAGREGFESKAEKAEQRWAKYVKQAKNKMKMPKTLDDFQNLLEQTHYLIPNHKQYYGYFGNLNKEDSRNFNKFNRING